MKPPVAKKIPYQHKLHGDVRQDDYYWLKEKTNPEVIQYLEEENKYYDEIMQPLKNFAENIFQRMVDRVPDTEEFVPIQHGPYFYYARMEKDKQYPIYVRKKAKSRDELASAHEEIVLDVNELAGEGEYIDVNVLKMSSDHNLLAYLENRDGTDRYTLLIKDMNTGELLSDRIPNVYIFYSLEWSNCGKYIFYITVDEQQRPYQLWRHRLGTDHKDDKLIYEEKDTTYTLFISKSQSGKFIFVHSSSKNTSEIRMLDADDPLSPLTLIDTRRAGIEYDVEHWGDDLLILTNENALNFKLVRASLHDLQSREEVIPHDEKRFLQGMYPFRNTLILSGRENGLTQVWKFEAGKLTRLEWDEPLYTVSVLPEQSYEADEVLIRFESYLTPRTIYGLHLRTGEKQLLQVAPVNGPYNPADYHQEQLWITAEDGVKVPLNMFYKKGALDNGPAPLILQGYGSYGANNDPNFSPYRLPILEKGVVFVTAQIRGGSEMGRSWYENGKMQKKRNTFTDFIAAAKFLIDKGYTTSDKLAARGGSAGGLLVGAVANMAGELFKVIVAEVPFVDVVTTMLDDTIPLTTLEWEEWGDPRKPDDYFYMKSYSPYDNVEKKAYPHMYVTAGLNDPRVGYWEPAKWVAKLRELKTDNNILVLKTNMGAGHYGSSGRFNQLKETAELYAFVLNKLGVSE